MIDSILLLIPGRLPDYSICSKIKPYDESRFRGRIENLSIYQSSTEVQIRGSLAKLLNGDNVRHLERHEIDLALDKLCEVTGLDCREGKVTSLEFGPTIEVQRPPSEYLSLWSSRTRMSKTIYYDGTSVSFANKEWGIYAYDKGLQSGIEPPVGNTPGGHFLRIELKYRKGLTDRFSGPVNAVRLSDRAFQDELIESFREAYSGIAKRFAFLPETIGATPAELRQIMASIALDLVGTEAVYAKIKQAVRSKELTETNASRMRAEVRALIELNRAHDRSDPTIELDAAIEEILSAW